MEPGTYTVFEADRAARAAMMQHFGEIPPNKNWDTKTTAQCVQVDAAWYDAGLSAMDVVDRVVSLLQG